MERKDSESGCAIHPSPRRRDRRSGRRLPGRSSRAWLSFPPNAFRYELSRHFKKMGAYLSEPVTEKISSDECGESLSYGASSMQGWRVSQEVSIWRAFVSRWDAPTRLGFSGLSLAFVSARGESGGARGRGREVEGRGRETRGCRGEGREGERVRERRKVRGNGKGRD